MFLYKHSPEGALRIQAGVSTPDISRDGKVALKGRQNPFVCCSVAPSGLLSSCFLIGGCTPACALDTLSGL